MEQFRPLSYDALQVGETFVSDTKLVTPEDVEAYAYAVDDHHPWFSEDSPFGGPIAHPTILANQALRDDLDRGMTGTRDLGACRTAVCHTLVGRQMQGLRRRGRNRFARHSEEHQPGAAAR